MKPINRIIIIIFALGLSSLACNLGFGRPATPEIEVPVVTAAPNVQLESQGGSTSQGSIQGGEPVVVTEGDLTSLINKELVKRVGDQLTNVQVRLQSDQIQISGDLDSQGISAPVNVVIEVDVDPIGRPELRVISSSVGPFPVPGDLVAEVEVLINKAFQEKVTSLAPNLHIDDIVIQNGVMQIYGHSN